LRHLHYVGKSEELRVARCKNTTDLSRIVADSLNRLLRGELDARIANAAVGLLGLQLRAWEQGPLHERIEKIEPELKEKREKGS